MLRPHSVPPRWAVFPRILALVGWCLLHVGLAGLPATVLQAQDQPVVVDYGPPLLRDWVQPEYPTAARRAKVEGTVTVEFVVEADGRVSRASVTQTTDESLNEAALAAVQKWGFKPGIDQGAPAPFAMRVPVVFDLDQLRAKPLFPPQAFWPVPLKETPAKPNGSIEPDYPAELEARKIPGEVHLEFVVNVEGRMEQPRVLWASHPAFVETALRAIERVSYTPAKQGPLARRSIMKYPVGFEYMNPVGFQTGGAKRAEILEANQLTLVGGEAPAALPQLLMLITPIYPLERLLAGEGGKVVAEFTLDEGGRPGEITIVSADYPEFGAAMRAAMESWVFRPAQGESGPIPLRLRATHEFDAARLPAESRLAALLQPGGAGVAAPSGLDQKLNPLWRGFPVYPQGLKAEPISGQAQIEFIIDRDGRARLPRILSATEESFGWAAATAISQWVFERPTKDGTPVDITVRIPVGFKPPKE